MTRAARLMDMAPPQLADILDAGPSPAALAAFTGRTERPTLLRVLFSAKRPTQSLWRQGDVTFAAEHVGENAEAHEAALRESLGKRRRGLGRELASRAAVADVAAGLVLRRHGFDTHLPGLRILHTPEEGRRAVAELMGADPGPLTATLAAHRIGKRAVVRLDAAGGQTYFARLRTDKSGSGRTAMARHRALWDHTKADPRLSLPEPLGEAPALGLALYAALPGAPPRFNLRSGRADIAAIGAALHALQELDLPDARRHGGAEEALILDQWMTHATAHRPEIAERLRPALIETTDALRALNGPFAPAHRDLHEKQILIHQGRAGLLDLDTLSLADPALDTGNLMAHIFLAMMLDGRDSTDVETAVSAEAPGAPKPRLRLWRRAALLRLSLIYAFSDMPRQRWESLAHEAGRP